MTIIPDPSQDLERFLKPQAEDYAAALAELQTGKKTGHWMWYIFPQLRGLSTSHTGWCYGIRDLKEAKAYLSHPFLGRRLREITQALLAQPERNARVIFGFPDCLKLRSSMTLFSVAAGEGSPYTQVLDEFFDGSRDELSLSLLPGVRTTSPESKSPEEEYRLRCEYK